MFSNPSAKVFLLLASKLLAMHKVEIHVFIEYKTNAETIYEMAKRNQIELTATSLDV